MVDTKLMERMCRSLLPLVVDGLQQTPAVRYLS